MRWTKDEAIAAIRRNGGTVSDKGITIPRAGIRVLGAIDYLVNHCGYHRTRGR